ncbi:acyl-CoA dehydrogenase family protein [Desulfallas sp. Bu1-1]|uniref:acyl-CoA dehydrogenase family protein n=1 Tax=Desulfallas sp. Bu1-1 TaxID=2787620 RepID=UPI00189E8BB5|nr:acyl-CoA dehydrogenase family protein [Desulfallas sp. Bu1-1]MBF7082507.1 acyl-CoA dehydrogenase family protein [Desulfallas sp. Bu1-1]
MLLTDQELMDLRLKVRKIVETEFEALVPEMEKTHVFPEKLWDICRANDLFRLRLPEQYGGMGLNVEQYFQVLEEISRGPGSIRMFLHNVNGLDWHILHDHGNEEMKAKWLPKMATEEYFITFSLTEPDCGSGADIRTTAVKKGDKYILNGRKTLISFTDITDAFYILAVTDESKRKKGGLSAFIVEGDRPGIRVEPMPHMMGCRGAGHGHVIMENCEIPATNILGKEGDGLDIFKEALAISRASIGVNCLGLSQRFLELAIARAKDRITFGKPLISRQAIQQMIADMGTKVHALRMMLWDCARQYDRGEDIEMKASMCKLFGIDTVREVSDSCLEIFGGIGYFEDNPYGPVERMYRDARALWFEEGPRTVQRLTIARGLIPNNGIIK